MFQVSQRLQRVGPLLRHQGTLHPRPHRHSSLPSWATSGLRHSFINFKTEYGGHLAISNYILKQNTVDIYYLDISSYIMKQTN